ncbi:YrdB family protein [Facklamia lactis]|uniref:YrdB family protein n=1 Tax=Facklamia lactis TaxID=2749967 RepID=UPI0018CE701D|nr:YrdB family protein [Facklamia lactis]MBG9979446.1 YrdB family protein [Facklamia lactis]
MLQTINDILSFLLELVALFLYSLWVYRVPHSLFKKFLWVFLIITMFAVVWGLFFSPKAKYPISGSLGWLLKFCVLFIPFIPFANELPVLVITMAVITFLNLWVQSLK